MADYLSQERIYHMQLIFLIWVSTELKAQLFIYIAQYHMNSLNRLYRAIWPNNIYFIQELVKLQRDIQLFYL